MSGTRSLGGGTTLFHIPRYCGVFIHIIVRATTLNTEYDWDVDAWGSDRASVSVGIGLPPISSQAQFSETRREATTTQRGPGMPCGLVQALCIYELCMDELAQ
jgi:hypothetical protein